MKIITAKAYSVNELPLEARYKAVEFYREWNSSTIDDNKPAAELEKDLIEQDVLFTEAGDVIKIVEDEIGNTFIRDYHNLHDIPITIRAYHPFSRQLL